MKITEKIKKFINRNNPELIADNVADSYQERKENGEKDPMDHTAEDIMKILKTHPDRKRTILAYISENDNIPDRIFEKVATQISKDEEIPDSVIADVVGREDTSISDESINNIIKEGKVNPQERIKLIRNIENKELLEKQVENELKILYKTCKDKSETEVKMRIEEIEGLLEPKDLNDKIKDCIQIVIAKKMAENYYNDNRKGTKIFILAGVMPEEEMLKRDLPSTVEEEYKKIEQERTPKEKRFNKKEFEGLILDKIANQIGERYKETGIFIIPQSENIKKLDKEQKEKFIKAIQTFSRKDLTREEIIDIDEQIRGVSENVQIKESTIIKTIKDLPKRGKNDKIDMATEILQDEKRFETISKLKESGLLEQLESMPKEKREKTIETISDAVDKMLKYKIVKNPPQIKGAKFSGKPIIDEEIR